jgi:hypothetical protein
MNNLYQAEGEISPHKVVAETIKKAGTLFIVRS